MTAIYELASLDVTTLFDRPTQALEVPATLRGGRETPLWLCEGADPAPRRLLRLVEPHATVGLRLDHRDRLRVRLALLANELTDTVWERERASEESDTGPSERTARGSARLVEVSAQGVVRGAATLARSGKKDVSRHVLEFDVEADDMAEGLLLLELSSPPGSAGLGPSVVPAGSVGCVVGWVDLEVPEPDEPLVTLDGRLSTGSEDLLVTHGVLSVGPSLVERSVRLTPAGRVGPGGRAAPPRLVDGGGLELPCVVGRDGSTLTVTVPPSAAPSYVLVEQATRFGLATRWVASLK